MIYIYMMHILYNIHRCLSTETYPLSWKTTNKLTISHTLGIFNAFSAMTNIMRFSVGHW